MKKIKNGILLTLCMFVMPIAVNAAATDPYNVSSNMDLTSDATYGSLRITDATLTIKEGVTLTIDGSEFITDTGSSDPESSLVLLNKGHIVMEEGSKLIITNTQADALAALYAQNNSTITLDSAILQVNNNETDAIYDESGLTITLDDSTFEVIENDGDGAYLVSGGIIANDSTIEVNKNIGTGLRSKVALNGDAIISATENEFTGIILLDGSTLNDKSYITAYGNNTGQTKIDADVRLLGTTTINDSAQLDASFIGPVKNYVTYQVEEGKIVVNGEEAILSFAYVVQVCEGTSSPDATCDEEDIVTFETDLQNGVIITTDENNEIIAIIGGDINTTEALEIPQEITRIIIEDTVTKDLNIKVEEETKIENNSNAKINVKLGEETIVVEAGKEVVVKATTTTDEGKKEDKKEVLPPNTGDMNLYIMISVILMTIGLTGFVGKKMYAKLK